MLHVTLLGVSGMMPVVDRWLSSAFIESNGGAYLIDCGEGTQYSARKYNCNLGKLRAVFFTHYHLDHILGLPGLLTTLNNLSRKEPLSIFGPTGLQHYIEPLLKVLPNLNYSVVPYDLGEKQNTIMFDNMKIESAPMEHTIPCLAYSFQVLRCGKFQEDKADKLNLETKEWSLLQLGYRIRKDGQTYCNTDLFGPPRKGIKVTYATDTRPNSVLEQIAKNSDLAILEGMYTGIDNDNGVRLSYMEQNAQSNKHMMFQEAAQIARNASVKELWLTHYSPMNTKPQNGLKEVKKIFQNTICGYCGLEVLMEFERK